MAADPQDAPRHAGQVVRRVLLRRNIAIDAETAQLVADAVQAALQAAAPRPPRRRPRGPAGDCCGNGDACTGYWNPLRPDLLAEQHLAYTAQLSLLATAAAQLATGKRGVAVLPTPPSRCPGTGAVTVIVRRCRSLPLLTSEALLLRKSVSHEPSGHRGDHRGQRRRPHCDRYGGRADFRPPRNQPGHPEGTRRAA